MKHTFTNSKRAYLLLLLFYAVFTSQDANAQSVTEVITNYQGYWKSSPSALNPVKPENSHELLSFTFNNVRYSTGVNDALLTTTGDVFSPQQFIALPMENMTGTPTGETFIGLGQMYDGVNNGGSVPPPLNNIPFYLGDGAQGLDIGTCVANIPVGYVSFSISQVNTAAIGDGVPDILITQIAQPSGATDQYSFKDANGVTVGNSVNIVLNNIVPVANWIADFYRVTANPMFIPPGFIKTERPMRLWAADFSDFGITAANINQIETFTINLRGTSDIAFIAYNYATATIVPLTPGVALLKEGTFVDTNNDCRASVGDVVNYTFKVTNTGQSPLTNVMVTDPMVTVSGAALATLAPGASNSTNFTATYTITQADVDAGVVYNQATVTGTDAQNAQVTSVSHDPTPIGASNPLYDPTCQFCTVTPLLQTPVLTGPASLSVSGCGFTELPLPFSEVPTTITLAQFLMLGGTTSNGTLNHIITYVDVLVSECPTTISRTFVVMNGCLSSTFVQTLTITDDIAPTASNPSPIILAGCNQPFPAPNANVVEDALDTCSAVEVTFVSDSVPTLNGCTETITRTYKVADACGNFVNVTQELRRTTDTVLPTASNPGDINLDSNVPVPAPNGGVVTDAADNCSEPTVTFVSDSAPVTSECTETIVRTYKVTDACNNFIEVTQNIIRNTDTTPPVAPVLTDITTQCSITLVPPTATDACAGEITASTNDLTFYDQQGSYVVNWTFDDGQGNAITVPQNIIVDVNAVPTPVLPHITEQCSVTVAVPVYTNSCTNEDVVPTTDSDVSFNIIGEYTINWTYDFGNDNIVVVPQLVSVIDTIAPVVLTLTDQIAECSLVVTAPTAQDECAGLIVGTTTDDVIFSSEGTYVINWTFNDGNGNSITVPQNVIIDDTTAPIEPVLESVTSQCAITVAAPTTTDACAGTITGTTSGDTTFSDEGVYNILWIFNDGNGNQSEANQTVVVDDNIAPVVPTLEDVSGICSATATVPTTTDNCAGIVTGNTTDSLYYNIVGPHTITWTFDDGHGNIVTATQTVIISAPGIEFLTAVATCNSATEGQTIELSSLLPAGTPDGGIWTDVNNSNALQGASFVATNIPAGFYTIKYEVSDAGCNRIFDINVEVNNDDCGVVEGCGNILVHNAFTPNNDGNNDIFEIESITDECHAVNSIEIFNRWGVMVYDAKGYNNASVSFKGISEGRATVAKDSELPTGTYFYILQYSESDGRMTKKDGYIYLSR